MLLVMFCPTTTVMRARVDVGGGAVGTMLQLRRCHIGEDEGGLVETCEWCCLMELGNPVQEIAMPIWAKWCRDIDEMMKVRYGKYKASGLGEHRG